MNLFLAVTRGVYRSAYTLVSGEDRESALRRLNERLADRQLPPFDPRSDELAEFTHLTAAPATFLITNGEY